MDPLLKEIRGICAGAMGDEELAPHLARVVAAIDRGPAACRPEARSLPPIERHLPACLAAARSNGHGALADAVAAVTGQLQWHDSSGAYGRQAGLEHVLDNYGFALLLGSDRSPFSRLWRDETVMFGLTLQAPKVFYPAHAHPAIELYYVIAGSAEWLRGAESWTLRPPGSMILHGSRMPHAMRTDAEPLLAFFAWVGDLGHRPVMVES